MSNAIKIFLPAVISFIIGILLTPIATHFFYKYKMWRKTPRSKNISKVNSFSSIHDDNAEISTPRTGGMIIWISVILTVAIVYIIDIFINNNSIKNLSFISRNQTLLPFFTLIIASILGLFDDFLQIFSRGKWQTDPIFLRYIKIGIILLLGLLISFWFYFKLGVTSLYIPWYGFINLGYLFIPFFIFIMFSLWSSSVIDGVDGLSGGVLASIFMAYTLIAYFNNQTDIATFSAVITGAIVAFLWFNIPPARFYMGETGMIGLTVTLSVLAFMTNTVLFLPIIAFPLFVTSLSSSIQIISRKFFNGKKVFILAPLHHHFEAIGWPKYKVTMRYWIVGIITSIIGVIFSLIG
jgi:phospho-N-acetylmuramoyl-pentapeptide-transferase